MSTGLMMMLKSLGIDPKMLQDVALAVQTAAADLNAIKISQEVLKKQNEEILVRLRALTPDIPLEEVSTEIPRLALVKNA